jgi:hypothetical protein
MSRSITAADFSKILPRYDKIPEIMNFIAYHTSSGKM